MSRASHGDRRKLDLDPLRHITHTQPNTHTNTCTHTHTHTQNIYDLDAYATKHNRNWSKGQKSKTEKGRAGLQATLSLANTEEEEEEESLAWRLGYLVRALSRIFRIQMILYSYSNDTIQRSLSYSMRPRQTFYTISGSVRWRTSGPR